MTKTLVLALMAVAALGASPVRAEEGVVLPPPKPRGFLTGLGIGFLVSSFVGGAVGLSGTIVANNATDILTKYADASIPASEEPTITALRQRASSGTTLAVVASVGAGLVFGAGLACFILDAPKTATTRVAFAPAPGGGVFVFSTSF